MIRFKNKMINDVSWNKIELVSRKGIYFPGMMYHRETKQFLNIVSLPRISSTTGGPTNLSLHLWP